MRQLLRSLADAVFPPRCFACHRVGAPLCTVCAPALPRLEGPLCRLCGAVSAFDRHCPRCRERRPAFDRVVAAWHYAGPVRRAILALKFHNHPEHARGLAENMAAAARISGLLTVGLVPVPLHPPAQRIRGYNQAELLARHTGHALRLPVWTILERTRGGPRQAQTEDAPDRYRNVAGAFRSRPLNGHVVWLVDDVCTTGATLDACAAALKAAGAGRVYGLVAARTESSEHRPED